ncbi:TniQ family protein [Streptomyces mirabilis]|uniref:TniQ family protein n=1 Tax=Streptomyces mirabilis TaxID=68239 RepID=UPI003696FCE3
MCRASRRRNPQVIAAAARFWVAHGADGRSAAARPGSRVSWGGRHEVLPESIEQGCLHNEAGHDQDGEANSVATRQLPRSLTPLEGESLPGYLLRSAYRLERSPAQFARLVGLASGKQSRIAYAYLRAMPEGVMREFSFAARLTEREADDLTLKGFTQTYSPLRRLRTGAKYIGDSAAVNWAVADSSRYCPDCLRGNGSSIEESLGGGWKLLWHLPVVFACVPHRRLLEHLCPACRQPLDVSGGRIGLVRYSTLAGLHPSQCRNALPHGRADPMQRAERTQGVACGMRLDRAGQASGSALASGDLDSLLALQQHILKHLSPQTKTQDESTAQHGYYLSDLIATTHLIKITWPMGAEFLPSSRFESLIEAYVGPIAAQSSVQHQSGLQKEEGIRGMRSRIAPIDSALCGALLSVADAALGNRELATLRPRIEPLAREAYRREKSYASKIFRSTDISPTLVRSVAVRIHGLPTRVGFRPLPVQHHYRVEEIPSFLPQEWFNRHFTEFIKYLPRFDYAIERRLRLGASLRLAELKSGGTWEACGLMIGMQPSLAKLTLKYLGRELEKLCLWPAFEETVEKVADYLDSTSERTDYVNRRRYMDSWRLPVDDWLSMHEGLPSLKRLRQWPGPAIGSALVWAEVTEGERVRSPVVLDLRQRGENTQAFATRLEMLSDAVGEPSLRLRRRIHLYAERLAVFCDKNLEPAVSVSEVIRDESAVSAGVIQEERPQASLAATIRRATLNRIVYELADPVGQMAPDRMWELFQCVVPAAADQARDATARGLGIRAALAAIVFVSTTPCVWRELPTGFGISKHTAFQRFTEWSEARVWTELGQLLRAANQSQGDLDWSRQAIDAVSARADKRRRGRS